VQTSDIDRLCAHYRQNGLNRYVLVEYGCIADSVTENRHKATKTQKTCAYLELISDIFSVPLSSGKKMEILPCAGCEQDLEVTEHSRKRRLTIPAWVRCSFCSEICKFNFRDTLVSL
jgi:hypothetical protein